MKQLTTKTDNDKIIEFLLQDGDEIQLSKKLQEKLERMDTCRDLIRKYGSRTRVANILINNFKISRAQAYRLFQDTQDVFGSTQRTSREFWLDIILGFMMETREKALIKGDFRSAQSTENNMAKAVEKLAGDKDTIPFEKVQPPQIMIGFFPETTKVELPEDWEDQVKKIIKPKRSIDQVVHDAQIVEEDGE